MKILLIHHRLPWPLNNGMDKLRYNLIRTLHKKYELTLIVPVNEKSDSEGAYEIGKYLNNLITIPVKDLRDNSVYFFLKRILRLFFLLRPYYISDCYSSTFNKKLKAFIDNNHFDYIHALSDFSGIYLLSQKHRSNLLLGPLDDNVQTYYEYYCDENGIKNKVISFLNYLLIKRYFKKILTSVKVVYFHSTDDLERATKRFSKKISACILPVATETDNNIVGFDQYSLEPESIVFVGGMGSSFNQDAVRFFMSGIYPDIKKRIPNLKFYIVGSHPPADIKQFHDGKQIIVTGAVAEIEPYVKRAMVYVSPVRRGTGIKTKMVEAFRLGKAIVATNKALQGLWEINSAIKVADHPNQFAGAVIEILENENIRKAMEENSLFLYNNHYDFDKVVPVTLKVYSSSL